MTREQTDLLLPPGLLSRCSSCARMLLLCPRSLRDPPAEDILGYYHSPQPLFSPNSPTRRTLLHLVPNPLFVLGGQTSVPKRLPAISRLRELRVPSPRHLLSPDSLFLIKHSISLHTGAPNCGRPLPPHKPARPPGAGRASFDLPKSGVCSPHAGAINLLKLLTRHTCSRHTPLRANVGRLRFRLNWGRLLLRGI